MPPDSPSGPGDMYQRWIRQDQHSKEEIGEAVILEQLLCILPPEVRTWVKEHEPSDRLMAAKLAEAMALQKCDC